MTADEIEGLAPCVHCGFCLQSCPTFVVTGDEADSPRGRIVLMQQLARGELDADDQRLTHHIDRCLGCRACETACPSGVVYGPALEATRAQLLSAHPLPPLARWVLAVIGESSLRRPALAVSRWFRPLASPLAGPSPLGRLFAMLAATRMSCLPHRREMGNVARSGESRGPAIVFQGCVMEGLFAHVNAATARTAQVNGFEVGHLAGQSCCGALHAHAGLHEDARRFARSNVEAFMSQPDAVIISNSAGCGAMLKDYGRLLADDPLSEAAAAFADRVRDVSEVLAKGEPRSGAPVPLRVAYDPPCHLQHAQRVNDPPAAVLNAIPGVETVVHADASHCCGSAGIYSLLQPDLSGQVLERKLAHLAGADVDAVVTGNPGCIMQIGAGMLASERPVPVVHPIELLDLSYARAGFYSS